MQPNKPADEPLMKKPTKKNRQKDRRAAEPFILLDSDPTNFWGDDKPKLKGKPNKVLTKLKPRRIIKPDKKLKRKDDKMHYRKQKQLACLAVLAAIAGYGFTELLGNGISSVIVAALLVALLCIQAIDL